MIALKLLAKMTKMPKKVNMLGSKNIKGKKKHHLWFIHILKLF